MSLNQKQEARRELYRALGFSGIVDASAEDSRVATRLSRWLADQHGLDLKASVVRRWLTKGDGWQEPRATIGLLILEWWKAQTNKKP